MEDILASIRRILSEDDQPQQPAAQSEKPKPPTTEPDDDVLVLDPSMMVQDPTPEPGAAAPASPPSPVEAPPVQSPPATQQPARDEASRAPSVADLIAPEAAAAAASSVGSLVRTLAAGRATQTHAGGPTIEDIVREEIRPLLKQWLDANLPPIVERFVRAEIERVVGRVVP